MSSIETLDRYQVEALRTAAMSPSWDKRRGIFGLGIAGEAAEVLETAVRLCIVSGGMADIIKKEVGHGHPENSDKMLKELGDLMWYIAVLSDEYGFSLSEVATANIDKLKARYPEGFSTEASINRE